MDLPVLDRLPDQELWQLSNRLGRSRLEVERRFLACCVEIQRRGLLARHRRFPSIADYARRVGGVSPAVMADVLALADRLRPYPRLWALLASGAQGWSKLRSIASVLEERHESWWVEVVERSSKRALENLVAEIRGRSTVRVQPAQGDGTGRVESLPRPGAADGLPIPPAPVPGTARALPGSSAARATQVEPVPPPILSQPFLARAEEHRQRLSARLGRSITLEQALGLALDLCASAPRGPTPAVPSKLLFPKRSKDHVEVVVRIAESDALFRRTARGWRPLDATERALSLGEPLARYDYAALAIQAHASARASRGQAIPDRVARFAWLRAGGACERPGCRYPGSQLHHLERRAGRATPSHDPERIALACWSCHESIHSGLLAEDPGTGTLTGFRLPGEPLTSRPTGGHPATDRIDARVRAARHRARPGG